MDQSLSDSVLVQLAEDIHPNNMTNLGVRLGFKIARIEQFRYNNPRDILKAMVDMLWYYREKALKRLDGPTAVNELCKALQQAESNEVAEKLRSRQYKSIEPCFGPGTYVHSIIIITVINEKVHSFWQLSYSQYVQLVRQC